MRRREEFSLNESYIPGILRVVPERLLPVRVGFLQPAEAKEPPALSHVDHAHVGEDRSERLPVFDDIGMLRDQLAGGGEGFGVGRHGRVEVPRASVGLAQVDLRRDEAVAVERNGGMGLRHVGQGGDRIAGGRGRAAVFAGAEQEASEIALGGRQEQAEVDNRGEIGGEPPVDLDRASIGGRRVGPTTTGLPLDGEIGVGRA